MSFAFAFDGGAFRVHDSVGCFPGENKGEPFPGLCDHEVVVLPPSQFIGEFGVGGLLRCDLLVKFGELVVLLHIVAHNGHEETDTYENNETEHNEARGTGVQKTRGASSGAIT